MGKRVCVCGVNTHGTHSWHTHPHRQRQTQSLTEHPANQELGRKESPTLLQNLTLDLEASPCQIQLTLSLFQAGHTIDQHTLAAFALCDGIPRLREHPV